MKLNVRFNESDSTMNVGLDNSRDESFGVKFGDIRYVGGGGTGDYNELTNRPSINSVVLEGDLSLSDLGYGAVYYGSTSDWNSQINLIAERGAIYIYSDYTYIEDQSGDQIPIAGLKIGDGTSYLIDMPYESEANSTMLIEHIANNDIHVTAAERTKWNNKVTAFMDASQPDTLVLSNL